MVVTPRTNIPNNTTSLASSQTSSILENLEVKYVRSTRGTTVQALNLSYTLTCFALRTAIYDEITKQEHLHPGEHTFHLSYKFKMLLLYGSCSCLLAIATCIVASILSPLILYKHGKIMSILYLLAQIGAIVTLTLADEHDRAWWVGSILTILSLPSLLVGISWWTGKRQGKWWRGKFFWPFKEVYRTKTSQANVPRIRVERASLTMNTLTGNIV